MEVSEIGMKMKKRRRTPSALPCAMMQCDRRKDAGNGAGDAEDDVHAAVLLVSPM